MEYYINYICLKLTNNKVKTIYLVTFKIKDSKCIQLTLFDTKKESIEFVHKLGTLQKNNKPYNVHDAETNTTINITKLCGKFIIKKIAVVN